MKPIKLKIQWADGANKNEIQKEFMRAGASILPEGPHGDWVMCQDEHIMDQACNIAHKNGCVLLDGEYKKWDPFEGSLDRNVSRELLMASLKKVYP